LSLAATQGFRSIAFPSIGTGAYGYPLEPAARIAVDSVREGVARLPSIELVLFVCFRDDDLAVYRKLLGSS
jgi:O-acetyl-ADP-ribose deacetylase (regulator of RNase III)